MEYLQYPDVCKCYDRLLGSFKPCYKWNTFNTLIDDGRIFISKPPVLNLVINGIPSIRFVLVQHGSKQAFKVLNLVINGIPSIHIF